MSTDDDRADGRTGEGFEGERDHDVPPADMPDTDPVVNARKVLDGIGERARADVKVAFQRDVLDAMLVLKRREPGEFVEVYNTLRDAKVPLREIARALKRRDAERRRAQSEVAAAAKQSDDPRVRILVDTNELRVNNDAVGALAGCDDLYQRGGHLVHVARVEQDGDREGIHHTKDTPLISPVPDIGIRERLTGVAVFYEERQAESDDGDPITLEVNVHPPTWCYGAVAARKDWAGIRDLAGVVEHPVLRPDGSVLGTPGYDPATRLVYVPSAVFPEVPARPALDDAIHAAGELLDLVVDFPFKADEHRAAWLASVLTPFARQAFEGCVPFALIDANTRGSGKSLLSDVTNAVVSGRPMPRMAPTTDENEERKRITALVMSGAAMVLVDNIKGALGTPALDAALTSTVWRDRVLGSNTEVVLPMRVLWFGTGNNVQLAGDMSRRVLHIRLESPLEHPEDRQTFRHPEVVGYAGENRGRLVRAALTVLRAWFVAGCPTARLPGWGSFEGWSRIVRNALVWCGQPDPAKTREELRADADTSAGALSNFIAGWAEIAKLPKFGGACTVAQVVKELEDNDAASFGPYPTQTRKYETLRDAAAELCSGGKVNSRTLPYVLRQYKDRVIGGRALKSASTVASGGALKWRVAVSVAAGGDGDHGDDGSSSRQHTGDNSAHPHGEDGDHGDDDPSHTDAGDLRFATGEGSTESGAHQTGTGGEDPHHGHHPHHAPSAAANDTTPSQDPAATGTDDEPEVWS